MIMRSITKNCPGSQLRPSSSADRPTSSEEAAAAERKESKMATDKSKQKLKTPKQNPWDGGGSRLPSQSRYADSNSVPIQTLFYPPSPLTFVPWPVGFGACMPAGRCRTPGPHGIASYQFLHGQGKHGALEPPLLAPVHVHVIHPLSTIASTPP